MAHVCTVPPLSRHVNPVSYPSDFPHEFAHTYVIASGEVRHG